MFTKHFRVRHAQLSLYLIRTCVCRSVLPFLDHLHVLVPGIIRGIKFLRVIVSIGQTYSGPHSPFLCREILRDKIITQSEILSLEMCIRDRLGNSQLQETTIICSHNPSSQTFQAINTKSPRSLPFDFYSSCSAYTKCRSARIQKLKWAKQTP